MHLGIVVVYKVKEENGALLDLHLSQIGLMTNVPYTIYAGVNNLQPEFRRRLEVESNLKICLLPETDLRMHAEHSFYLERLVRTAIDDGVSHVVILHVDSFPIRPDWVETILNSLTGEYVLTTVSHDHYLIHYTVCLFFTKKYYQTYNPSFLLSESDRSSQEYQHFKIEYPHHEFDSGVGFVYDVYRRGLSWNCLEKSNIGEERGYFGSIYGDLVFHLKGACRYRRITKLIKFIFVVQNKIRGFIKKAPKPHQCQDYSLVLVQLLNNPQEYIDFLRYGNRK